MTSFEVAHPRADDGRFATKPQAEVDVQLEEPSWRDQPITVEGRRRTLGDVYGGRLFHGSRHPLTDGDLLEPGKAAANFAQSADDSVSITSGADIAYHWAKESADGGQFWVYEVEPEGHVEVWRAMPANGGKSVRLQEARVPGARVLRQVDLAEAREYDSALHRGEDPLTYTDTGKDAEPSGPHYASLEELETAGYVTDEWQRWQQGGCAAYAVALVDAHPHLKFAVMGNTELGGGDASEGWSESHAFAHDDEYAYDSAGRHPLPYLGVEASNDYVELDQDPEAWGYRDEFMDKDFAAAIEHAERHHILTRDPVPHGGH